MIVPFDLFQREFPVEWVVGNKKYILVVHDLRSNGYKMLHG